MLLLWVNTNFCRSSKEEEQEGGSNGWLSIKYWITAVPLCCSLRHVTDNGPSQSYEMCSFTLKTYQIQFRSELSASPVVTDGNGIKVVQ